MSVNEFICENCERVFETDDDNAHLCVKCKCGYIDPDDDGDAAFELWSGR